MTAAMSKGEIVLGAQQKQHELQVKMKELKEVIQTLQKELQDEKSNHQMTQLRAEKQEVWNQRELAQLKDE
jgi:hypothetical protein